MNTSLKNILTTSSPLTGREAFSIAVVGNILLFIAGIVLGFPVFHSGDDLNIAWMLGDGYGSGATTCLPFLHGQHYWFSTMQQWLFSYYPNINWFSWSMIVTEFASMVAIYFVLLRMQQWQSATINFLVLFMVYGSFLLFYLHISSTTVMAVTAGLLLTWFSFSAKKKYALIAAALFFIIGTLFRLHAAFPVMVVAAPFFLLIPGRKKWTAAVFITGCLLISVLSFWIQQKHFTANCPNWQSEENYRQAKYANINFYRNTKLPALDKYQQEISLLDQLILPDTNFIPATVLNKIADESQTVMPLKTFLSADTWHWPYINNRLYLLGAVLALCFNAGRGLRMICSVLSFLGAVAVIIYLVMVMRLPEFMIPALFFTFYCFTATVPAHHYSFRWRFIALASALVLSCWGIVRTYKTGMINKQNFAAFKQMHQELAAHPDKLFISIGENDPFFYVSVFATPKEFSFQNILFVDQPESLRKETLLKQFGYTDFNSAIFNPNAYFRGPELDALTKYYELKTRKQVNWGQPIGEYKFSTISKPMLVDLVIPASK